MYPIITSRLTLRPPELEDALVISRSINDWEVIRWLSRVPYPYKETDAIEFIERAKINRTEGTAFRFVIIFMNEIIGGIGLERIDQSTFELGYWITRSHWGNGFATEATSEIIEFAFKQLAASRILASCHEQNIFSEQVLLKNNFVRSGVGLRFSTSLGKNVRDIQFFRGQAGTDCST